MARPWLSVVVLTWNSSGDLLRCIRSIERCDGGGVELIVVDNGSNASHAERLARALGGTSVRLLRCDHNVGVAGGRNLGLSAARGRYLSILDDDCVVTKGALSAMTGHLDEHRSVGVVGPRIVGFDGALQLSARRVPGVRSMLFNRPPLNRVWPDHPEVRRYLMADAPHDRVLEVDYVLGACQVFRREVWERLGPLDEGIFYGPEDADWCLRVRDAGWQVHYVPQAVVFHHYRRLAAANPLGRHQLSQLTGLARFFYRNRRVLARVAPAQNPLGWLPW